MNALSGRSESVNIKDASMYVALRANVFFYAIHDFSFVDLLLNERGQPQYLGIFE